jgi:uncharacterized protein YjiS (DUF1127 family)
MSHALSSTLHTEAPTLKRSFLRGAGHVLHMAATARQRQQLRHLDAARLADLGLSRAEAEAEAARPFWDAPQHWQR